MQLNSRKPRPFNPIPFEGGPQPYKPVGPPSFNPMPFEGGMTGSKGSPVMAGGMPYPRKQEAPTMWAGGSPDWLGNQRLESPVFPTSAQYQPVFSPMPFEGGGFGNTTGQLVKNASQFNQQPTMDPNNPLMQAMLRRKTMMRPY